MAVALIYSSYPDYNKTPKEFLATMATTLMQWPESIIYQIADKRTGIQTRQEFPPNAAHLTKMAEELIAKAAEVEAHRKRYEGAQRRRVSQPSLFPRAPFRPFPALWAAFQDDPEVMARLDSPGAFEVLDDAARALVTMPNEGKTVARRIIMRGPRELRPKWEPPRPAVDISDLPDRAP